MKKKIRLREVPCPLCGAKTDYQIIYKGNFSKEDFNKDIYSARRLPDRIHYQIVKCNHDGLIRSSPVLKQEDLHKLYEESSFTYAEEVANLSKSYLAVLDEVLINLDKNSKILEIGCGNGFMLSKLFGLGYRNVFGLELSVNAVKKADKTIATKIYLKDIREAPELKDNSFDFIFLFQTFDHLSEPTQFLAKCHCLLKKGGKILTLNHNVESLQSRVFGEKSPIFDIEHTFLYSPATLRLIFEKNGFKVVKLYSPKRLISLRELFKLLPIPNKIKKSILNSKAKILKKSLNIRLGNLCLIAQK